MVRLCGLTKQDYLARRALDEQVAVVPSSRVLKALRGQSESLASELSSIADASQFDDRLLGELRWLAGIMASFARYGEEDFDAVERIVNLRRE